MRFHSKIKRNAAGCLAILLSFATISLAADAPLVEAAKNQDRAAVRALLAQKADVNAAQGDGATALAWAAHWSDAETAALLIRAGADVNRANDYGVTPLALACTRGNAVLVGMLLDAGANPNAARITGETPLMTCARTGSAEAVKLLLDRGADANAKEPRRGQTALMWAVAQKHSEAAAVLMARGADVNAVSHMPDGFTPAQYLTYGVYRRDPTQVDTFGPNDVHPDPASSRGGFTALMFAAREGGLDSARLLVEAGAHVNHTSPEYGSALVVAAASGHEEFARFLLDRGADPNRTDLWGFTALHYALRDGITAIGMSRERIPTDSYWLKPGLPELVKPLLDHGADPNARVGDGIPAFDYPPFQRTTGNMMPQVRQPGATPFFLAAASLDVNLMRLLLDHGADPTLTTAEGTTPLMVASGMGRLEDLTEAEQQKALEAARLALEKGNDVNAANQDGRTALAAAAYVGANNVIQLLAEHGADLEAKDRYGQTALSIARGVSPKFEGGDKRFHSPSPHPEAAEILLQLGAKPLPSGREAGQ
jgi:ankyrin repeat protein